MRRGMTTSPGRGTETTIPWAALRHRLPPQRSTCTPEPRARPGQTKAAQGDQQPLADCRAATAWKFRLGLKLRPSPLASTFARVRRVKELAAISSTLCLVQRQSLCRVCRNIPFGHAVPVSAQSPRKRHLIWFRHHHKLLSIQQALGVLSQNRFTAKMDSLSGRADHARRAMRQAVPPNFEHGDTIRACHVISLLHPFAGEVVIVARTDRITKQVCRSQVKRTFRGLEALNTRTLKPIVHSFHL
jgi:hypothetical protein